MEQRSICVGETCTSGVRFAFRGAGNIRDAPRNSGAGIEPRARTRRSRSEFLRQQWKVSARQRDNVNSIVRKERVDRFMN